MLSGGLIEKVGTVEAGGTITGDLTIEGDLTVEGSSTNLYDEIVEGGFVVDATDTEALLIRKASDGGDVFTIDTSGETVRINSHDGSTKGLKLGATLVTSTASELNILDGASLSTTELNYVDGVTSAIQTQMDTKAPLASPTFTGTITIGSASLSEAELEILDGASLSTSELNLLDGVTATTAELNYLDVTTLGTVEASKAITVDASGNIDFNNGNMTNIDIDSGAIDGTNITVGSGKTLDVSGGTFTLASDQISGDKVNGGTISAFASTGIDDNASSNALTIDSSQNLALTSGTLTVYSEVNTGAGNRDIHLNPHGTGEVSVTATLDATAIKIASGTAMTAIKDEDNMASDSATSLSTQQSIKAYVDAVTTSLNAQDLDFQGDSGGALNIDLDTEVLDIAGDGAGIATAGSGNQITISGDHDSLTNFVANEHIDHTAVTLTAGDGLSGGGTIASSRTFAVDLNELTTETTIADADFIAMVDATDSGSGKITFENLEDAIFSSVSGDVLITEAGVASIQANSVALATDTTGDYVSTAVAGDGIDVSGATGDVTISVEVASTTNSGMVELATTAETNTGTDTGRVVTPAGLTAWTGDTAIVTVGTIGTGSWESSTDVAVLHGGTGASDASTARTNLGVDASGTINYTHPHHSGDVTSVNDGATTIANDAVTYAKMQNVSATNMILGRDSALAGDVEEITPANVRTMINVEDGSTADQSGAEIKTAYEAEDNAYTDTKNTKLSGIEASADVTDSTNVNSAGAVMESDVSGTPAGSIIDDDTMATASNTKLSTSESIKAYVDSVAQGLNVKSSCAVATTANITLSGEQTIDGVVTSDSRVLVKDQSSASENGVYVTASGSWARATDFDAPAEVASSFVFISGGTAGADTGWVCTNEPESVTVDTDDITFSQFSDAGHITAGTGLTKSGNSISINASQSTITSIGTLSGATPLVFEGDTANDYETSISVTDPTADNTWTIPDSTDTFVGKATTDILTNKTLTSPRIGTSILDTSGNELFNLTATSSAVNEFTVANSATGNSPTISATGGDSNIDITITPKGTGEVNIGAGNLNYAGTAITATGAEINLLDGITTLSGSNTGDQTLPTDFVSAASGGTFSGNVSFGDNNITNVGDISLDSISSDAGTSINVVLGSDAGDDFTVDTSKLVVEGDTGNVGIGCTPSYKLSVADSTTGRALQVVQSGTSGTTYGIQGGAYGAATKNIGLSITSEGATTNDAAHFMGGNVGIGTTAPDSTLHVNKDDNGSARQTIARFTSSLNNRDVFIEGRADVSAYSSGIKFDDASGAKFVIASGDSTDIMTFTDTGNVGIGTVAPSSPLHIKNTGGANTYFTIEGTATDQDIGVSFQDGTNVSYCGMFGNTDSNLVGDWAVYNGGFRFVVQSDGKVGIGTTTPGNKLIVVANDASNWGSRFVSDGNNSNRYGIVVDAGADDAGGTNYAISIRDGDGGDQGHITFTSGTITYGAFTAHHEVSLPNADADSEYPYGTLVETVNIYYRQKDGSDTERGIRYNVKKTSSAYSKKVLGSYGGSMNNNPSGESNLHQVLILGDGHILCNSEKGNIEIGDGICTSSSEGEGMKADKTAMIIGIAQEDVSFSGEESKLVAVQFGLSQFTPW